MAYCYDYPRPMVTVDIMVFHPAEGRLAELLLIQRKNPPFQGQWAFPGGFMDMHETLETAAMRELKEETGIANLSLRQFKTVSTVDRDPRGRTLTTVFTTHLNKSAVQWQAADDASSAKWFPLHTLPPLAFDHEAILAAYLDTRKHARE